MRYNCLRFELPFPVGLDAFAIVRVQRLRPAEIAMLFPFLAGVSFPGRLRFHEPPFRIGAPRHVRDDGDERAISALAVTQLLLGLLALGDVENDREENPLPAVSHRLQVDFHRIITPIRAPMNRVKNVLCLLARQQAAGPFRERRLR